MNNSCPSCGAIYNVAAKDVGRRIRCKKCQTALVVTENGLELDQPGAAAAAAATPFEDVAADDDGDDIVPSKKAKAKDRGRRLGAGIDPGEALAKIGGIPTLLFGFGVFLVVFTGFQEAIGKAKIERRIAQYNEAKADHDKEIEAINNNKDVKESDKSDRIKKENERWEKEEKSLKTDQTASTYANQKSGYVDKYFLMFGFLLIAFGCLGYLRADSALLLRVVAGIILTAMVLGLFKMAVGGGAAIGAGVAVG
jgi:predicted Zn finger-like uncharacterized protein